MTPRLSFLVVLAANVLAQSVFPVDETQQQQNVLNSQQPYFNPPIGHLRRFDFNDSDMLSYVLGLAERNDLDLWQVGQSHIDIYSPPSAAELPISLLELPHSSRNITLDAHSFKSSTKPLAESFEDWNLRSLANTTYHSDYHPLFEIEGFINQLAALYPNTTQLHRLGHSGQGREMVSLTISKGVTRKDKKERGMNKKQRESYAKPAFVIIGAQHAREWVATATSLYLAHALTSDASEPHSLSSLLDVFDFHIIPSPNPDGYDYTWESDRFWYKTRQNFGPTSKCLGLDMNRNWGYKWKSRAPSPAASLQAKRPDPCSTWYPGRRPFQAPEVNNIANWVSTLPHLVGFIGLRSYGQMLSSPYSYSCKKIPKDAEDQIEAAFGAARAMHLTHGVAINTGTLCEMLYRAPGNIVDWMYKRARIKYSYVVHLRDTGTYGFSLPSRWIRPVGEETGEMVKYLARFIAKKMNKDF